MVGRNGPPATGILRHNACEAFIYIMVLISAPPAYDHWK